MVGYLNHYLCDWTDPPLTTISLEPQTAAAKMVTMLERMITEILREKLVVPSKSRLRWRAFVDSAVDVHESPCQNQLPQTSPHSLERTVQ